MKLMYIFYMIPIFLLVVFANGQLQIITTTRATRLTGIPIGWCLTPITPGFCKGRTKTRYAYDADKEECVAFQYTGCGGNSANRYRTLKACQIVCEQLIWRAKVTKTALKNNNTQV